MDENVVSQKVTRGRKLAVLAIALCLLLATPPFFGFCYSFYICDIDLAIFKFVANDAMQEPILRLPIEAWVTLSMFPSYVIATLFPIQDVTIFKGEGMVAPKPIVTVAFWLTMALCSWLRMRRKATI